MLSRIEKLEGLGLFKDFEQPTGCEFSELTLVYGENGCGKSTLAALFDSLRSSDNAGMLRRTSLGRSVPPIARVKLDSTSYVFGDRAWERRPPNNTIDVFFSGFVARSVYSGASIESDHRRQLCEFALGPTAVTNIEKLSRATLASSDARKEITRIEGLLKTLVRPPHSLAQFELIEKKDDVSARLALAEKRLAAAKRMEEEVARTAPSAVPLPVVPTSVISEFLSMSTDCVAAEAIIAVRTHIQTHLDREQGEEWLSYGATHLTDVCPFCAQNVVTSPLAQSITDYFSDAYRSYTDSVRGRAQSLRDSIGTSVIDEVVTRLAYELSVAEKWQDQYSCDVPTLIESLEVAATTWRSAARLFGQTVGAKLSTPLDAISESAISEPLRLYEESLSVLGTVNTHLTASCEAVSRYKQDLKKADVESVQLALNTVQNESVRYQEYALDLLAGLDKARKKRKALESDRGVLKTKVEESAARVVGTYQDAINYYLSAFGCEMQIEQVKTTFPAGKASVSFELLVRGHSVPLVFQADKPCFQTALSEGDRTSLALAFFLARLRDQKRLDGRTVVLDDPVDSFGSSRRRAVRIAIRDLANRGAQIVILTHDDALAAMIWRDSARGALAKKNIRCLQLVEVKSGPTLTQWDAERATRGRYFNDYATLEDFLDDKVDHETALKCIRPYLESRIRYLFPGTSLTSRDALGDIVGKIRNAGTHSPLKSLAPRLRDLDELNDACLPSAHASDDVVNMPVPGRKEVRRYVELAISF